MRSVEFREQSATRSGPRAAWLGSLALVLGSVLAGLLLLEIGCRLLRGPEVLLDWSNLVLASRLDARKAEAGQQSAYDYHPTFGFVNRPGYRSVAINFDAEGFRQMPPLPPGARQGPPILATGDSYTKGDEVADAEAWPQRLQEILGWRTVNAGVGAYGLDQTVLLTEQLVARLKPAVLVVGFIADDVRRAEMRRVWGREKPFFEGAGSELALRNVPVPPPPEPRQTLSPLQAAFGWSVLLDTVLDRLRWRNAWHMDNARVLPSGAGERLACPLMRRIAALGVPTLVVAQYLPSAWDVPESAAEERRVVRVVLDCAERMGLHTLDLFQPFGDAVRAEGRAAVYGEWHPSARGYQITADAIARELRAKLAP